MALGLSAPQHEVAFRPERDLSNNKNLPYAILECDRSEISINATSGTRENPVWAPGNYKPTKNIYQKKFDIFRASELIIRLYTRGSNKQTKSQYVFIGCAKMHPVYREKSSCQTKWLPIENGTGKLLIETEYHKSKTLRIETLNKPRFIGESRFNSAYKIQKSGTDCCYASIHIPKADLSPYCDVIQALHSPINTSPFIEPLKFIAQTRSQLCLFWPFIPGDHLFYHLQKAQRFQPDRTRLYTAEILLALEAIHKTNPSYHELKPKNILLDSVGHIVVCDLGLLPLKPKRNMGNTTDDFAVDYLAPESLESLSGDISANTDTTASKWWTLGSFLLLGSFLFEMLTGLPPFYDQDVKQRHRNILSGETLDLRRILSESAQDLLNKLLTRNPKDRLGAMHGASEIKAHRFFDGLDWEKVARREYVPIFKPHRELVMAFQQELLSENWEEMMSGFSWGKPTVVPAAIAESRHDTNEKKDDWELVSQHQSRKFCFYNRSTNIEKPITPNKKKNSAQQYAEYNSIVGQYEANTLPTTAQIQTALEAVLENKYMYLLPTLLKRYNINLNTELVFAHTTPLDYATGLKDVETVRLFLDHGADANLNPGHYTLGGRPLLTAVHKSNLELAELLIHRTSRIPCTRALAHAVTKKDLSMVSLLLAYGVNPNFEDSDRPPSFSGSHSDNIPTEGTTCGDRSEPDEYLPPLIRAVILGDIELVQFLLAYGADSNIGYHDMSMLLLPGSHSMEPLYMHCGRPIHLAMELGYADVVHLLLEYGADVELGQPVWEYHECRMIPREVYHRIVARLRAAAAGR